MVLVIIYSRLSTIVVSDFIRGEMRILFAFQTGKMREREREREKKVISNENVAEILCFLTADSLDIFFHRFFILHFTNH